jgi:two-component system KDP operon response regulator KdpE
MSKLILHLDDEPAIREILAAALTAHGYRVLSVTTSAEALHAAKQEPPDLLISDLQLEEDDGLQAIAQVRALLPGLPVIILTGVLVDARIAQESVAREADSYLTKTTPLAKIIEEVRRLAGG